jgi:putative membrane protein insertion efficiency factor
LQQQRSLQPQPRGESTVLAANVRVVAAPAVTGAFGASGAARRARSIGSWALLFLVRAYIVFLSPFFGGACKFYPSCSNYAREAIEHHGARRGTALALKRLLRCHPFTRGGIDLVPDELPDSARASRSHPVHLAASGQGKAQ